MAIRHQRQYTATLTLLTTSARKAHIDVMRPPQSLAGSPIIAAKKIGVRSYDRTPILLLPHYATFTEVMSGSTDPPLAPPPTSMWRFTLSHVARRSG